MALAAVITTGIEHIQLSGSGVELLHGHVGIVLMMHGIKHQHVCADDQQQCPDQCLHGACRGLRGFYCANSEDPGQGI